MIDNDVIHNSLKELVKEKDFKAIFLEGLKLLKPSKYRIIFIILILLILVFPIYNMTTGNDTIAKFQSFVEYSNEIIKDLFGVIFTGYALFQALIGVNALKQMLINKIGKHSSFKAYNLYFFILSILYLYIILLNYIIIIILKNINFAYFNMINNLCKNAVAFILIFIYTGINIFVISEIKSFLVNMYHCFNMSVFSEGIDIINKENESDNS